MTSAQVDPRLPDALQAEAAVAVAVLNRMLDAGSPDTIRRLNTAA
jgi:hypothetical protein